MRLNQDANTLLQTVNLGIVDKEIHSVVIEHDLVPHLSKDKTNTLYIENRHHENVRFDSATAYAMSMYYMNLGSALKRIEEITSQKYIKHISGLDSSPILLDNDFQKFVGNEYRQTTFNK